MFWILDRPLVESNAVVYAAFSGTPNDPTWETQTCPSCGRSRIIEQTQSVRIELYGESLRDFVWTDGPEVMMSVPLTHLLENSNLKGFAFRIVDILAWWRPDPITHELVDWVKREPGPQLFQLVVTGKGGSIFPPNKVRVKAQCTECGVTIYEPLQEGIQVDQTQWDGSDIFVLDEFPGYILITDEFLNFLKQNAIQGYSAVPSLEYLM